MCTQRAGLLTLALALCSVPGVLHAQSARDLDEACSAIAKLALPQTRITRAEPIHVRDEHAVAGTENGIGLSVPVEVHRSFCRVAGVVEPAINFETWMPLDAWNGRFHGAGLGAFWGKLPYRVMAQSLEKATPLAGPIRVIRVNGTMRRGRSRTAPLTRASSVIGLIAAFMK
jgi:hypothetical protein